MIIEISVAVIAVAFVILVVFLVLTLLSTRKTLEKANRVLNDVHKNLSPISEASLELIQNANKLTEDIKKKSEALDVLFRPFQAFRKDRHDHSGARGGHDQISEILEFVASGMVLFNKIKEGVRNYVKSR